MADLKAGFLAEPVLVGREHELELLKCFLTSTFEGKGKTVFISGEAGSGKTRLVREFLKILDGKGLSVMAGWCLSDSAAPYFPFVEAFNSYFSSSEKEEYSENLQLPNALSSVAGPAKMVSGERGITSWLTGSANLGKTVKQETVSPQVWKDQVYASVVGTLHEISAHAPVVLFLEDVHWADSASLALLHYVARAVIDAERILVLATFRSDELTTDAEGHPHPLAETLRMMKREDLFTEIKLENLSQASVAEIAKNMIGGNLQQQLAERLVTESRGNPLFVVESLRMLNEHRSLVEENNEWRLAIGELGIPSKIRDIILRRLAALNFAQRRVLDAASVIGEKFDVALLSAVLGMDNLEVLETLNIIAYSTSLISVEENCYRFDHARSRETLYTELSQPLKRGYHLRVAERLESTAKKSRLPYAELAHHFSQAGNTQKAVKCALSAGKAALERFSNAEAIKHFVYVLHAIPETQENTKSRRVALEGLGDAYYANRRYEDAIRTFETLANSSNGALKQRAYIKEMEAVWFKGSDPAVLFELAEKAEADMVLDRLGRAYVHHNKGRALLHMKDLPGTLKEHEEALRIFKEEYFLPKVADLTFAIGTIHAVLKMLKKGFGEMLQGLNLFHELGDLRGEMMVARLGLGQFFVTAGLFQDAARYFRLAFQIGEKIGAYDDMAIAYDWLGSYQLFTHAHARAENAGVALSHTLKALEYVQKTDAEKAKWLLYTSLVMRYAMLGDSARAEEFFAKLMTRALTPKTLEDSLYLVFPKIVVLCIRGLWEEAEKEFEKNEGPGSSLGWQMIARSIHAWALGKQGKVEAAKAQLSEFQRLTREAEMSFAHVNLQASLMVKKELVAGEESELRLDLVNVARSSGSIVKIEDMIPTEFQVKALPAFCILQGSSLITKEKNLGSFQVVTIKVKLKATEGIYRIAPEITYIDDLGENKTYQVEPSTINVRSAKPAFEVLPNRMTTGYSALDRLLFGGIPQDHAVILSSTSGNERELLTKKFLEAGLNAKETTFFVTAEPGTSKTFVNQYPSIFHLLICNSQADSIVQSMPNVYKLKGVENLTDIDIALTKMIRMQKAQAAGPRRLCINNISDILLQHHALSTRRWLSALLPTLKSKGFTVLAVIDSGMHAREEQQAVLSVFDGEIMLSERETPEGTKQVLKVKKLCNQRFSDKELIVSSEKLAKKQI